MIETLKTIGAFLGLLGAPFFLYDRIAKWRPLASLTIRKDGDRKIPCIRLSNITPHDIAIIGWSVHPSVYFLTEDLEVESLVRGAAGRVSLFMLKAGESKELVIAPKFKDGIAMEITPQSVNFWFYWRRGNATWVKQIPVPVCTSTETIRMYGLERK